LTNLQDFADYARENHLKLDNMQILVQLEILNSGSHFSEEKFNLAILYTVLLMVYGALTVVNYKKY
jgi:hypothetical protein